MTFLCTGNATRSVLAGAAVAALVPDVRVETAGTLVVEGQPMSWRTREAFASVGLAVPTHRSRQAEPAALCGASLVVAMAPEHVEWVRRSAPGAAPRTATLRRLCRDLRPGGGVVDLDERLRSLRLESVELETWEEIADPGGGELTGYLECADEVLELATRLAVALGAER